MIQKRLAFLVLATGFCFGQGQNFPGGSSTVNPSVSVLPSGLTAEYRMLASETPASLVDYSGSGNGAVGTVGTAPTMVAGSGGISCTGNGAIKLPAALNSTVTYFFVMNYQSASNVNTYNAVILGNNGTNNNGLLIATLVQNGTQDSIAGGDRIFTYTNSLSGNNYSYSSIQGIESIAIAMGAPGADKLYLNGVTADPSAFNQPNSQGVGIQTAGQYQLCGGTAGAGAAVQTYLTGTIYYAAFWNRQLTAQEISQVHNYASNLMSNRGIFINPLGKNTAATNQMMFDGDSITVGINLTTPWSAALTLNGTWNIANQGKSSKQLVANANPEAPFAIDPMSAVNAAASADAFWLGTNDCVSALSAANILAGMRPYCVQRRSAGWKCFPATMISRTGQDTCKNSLNVLVRQHWTEFADGLIDVAADPNLGADGANANATYFQGDLTHPTQYAAFNDVAPIMQRNLNRYYGNNDFSSATTYTVAALAATATTAGSEATNTVTLTFGATPANCLVNKQIVVAGTTPAGYSGTYNILTRSATQVTYNASTASMGVITVQGTGVCPQQQDADTYTILGGSAAGNPAFTMESCQGYTGQNLYFKNTNTTSAWVLTPFVSAETIDGAATLTMPTASSGNFPVVILQAQLISAAAGGCTWQRFQ